MVEITAHHPQDSASFKEGLLGRVEQLPIVAAPLWVAGVEQMDIENVETPFLGPWDDGMRQPVVRLPTSLNNQNVGFNNDGNTPIPVGSMIPRFHSGMPNAMPADLEQFLHNPWDLVRQQLVFLQEDNVNVFFDKEEELLNRPS